MYGLGDQVTTRTGDFLIAAINSPEQKGILCLDYVPAECIRELKSKGLYKTVYLLDSLIENVDDLEHKVLTEEELNLYTCS